MALLQHDDPDSQALSAMIRRECVRVTPPLTPELSIWGATPETAFWQATQETLDRYGIAPPFWPFAWPGGQALARFVLDHAKHVSGKRVVALACGAGLEAIAAARSGAAAVLAIDNDPMAIIAAGMNARLNDVVLDAECADILNRDVSERWLSWAEIILVGDVFYDSELAEGVSTVLARAIEERRTVYVGDPGRSYPCRLPCERLVSYDVRTAVELEGVAHLRASVSRLLSTEETSR